MRTISPQLAARIEAWDGTAVPPRDAATVVVLRDAPTGRETFLIRRRSTMAFAAGQYVFPGGGVQESDFAAVPWIGPGAGFWAGRLGCPEDLARALVVAAARELFEETGLLLAGPDQATVVGGVAGSRLAADRQRLEAKDTLFGDLLGDHDLKLRADLLSPWAHWITPAYQPRRFDTRFFVAMLPAGQTAGSLTTESDLGQWAGIGQVLQDARNGRVEMMRPTQHTLRQLLGIGDQRVAEAAAQRTIVTIEPRLVEIDGVHYLDSPAEENL